MPETTKACFLVFLAASALTACRSESVAAPFGLRIRERPGGGSVASAIRSEALNYAECGSLPAVGSAWTVRTMTNPSGRVLLPPLLEAIAAQTREVTFLARDLTAGAFVSEAPSVASLEVPDGSPLSRSAIRTCRWRAGSSESMLHLISQLHPTQPGDSVHLAFLQIAAPGEQALRAGAFATTRALRDSLISALLAFQPDLR